MDNPVDLRCRACLREFSVESMYPLAKEKTVNLFRLTSISFHDDDQMPQRICTKCYNECVGWNTFRLMAISSDNILRAEKELNAFSGMEVNDGEDGEINLIYVEPEEEDIEIVAEPEEEENLPSEKTSNVDEKMIDSDEDEAEQEEGLENDPLVCDLCEKRCKSKSTLKQHKMTHNREEMKFACKICKKRFPSDYQLVRHTRIHTGSKPFTCPICEKSFTVKSNLKKHERIHTGLKPFTCPVCEKSFRHANTLKEHERIHTGDKSYKCPVCKESFRHARTLKDHGRIHTGERPFKCSICTSSFKTASNLKRHFKTHESQPRMITEDQESPSDVASKDVELEESNSDLLEILCDEDEI